MPPLLEETERCKCNYCGKLVHGGITRLKQHIAHVSENVEACSRVPPEIRKMVRKLLDDGIKEKAASLRRKEALINAVREESLYCDKPNIHIHVSDDDDDDIDEHGMSALGRKQLKQAMAESRYMGHVEEEIRRNPSRGAGFYGGSSKGSTSGAKRGISQSFGVKSGVEMPSIGFDAHMFSSGKRTIKGMLSKEGMKKVGKAVSKFFIFNALPFNAADSGPYMQSMIDTIAEVGPGVKGPSGYQIGGIYLNEEIVTDNESSFRAAGEMLMQKKNHLFWSPCAAHCIDLMLEDIEKMRSIKATIDEAKRITSFIYNSDKIVNLMKIYTKDRELLRPGITRFATEYIALESLIRHQMELRQLCTCDEWRTFNNTSRRRNEAIQIRLFVDKLGEFESPLARQAVSTSLPTQWWYNYGDEAPNLRKIAVKVLSQTCASSGCERNWSTWSLIHTKLRNRLATEKLHKLVYAHYNMRLRVRNLMYQREDDDYYNPIDLNHIFHDNDILEEWTREAEEPLLPENNLDWLDEEGRMDNVENDEDDDASLPLSRWSIQRSSKGKGKNISSKEKGKQVTFKDKRAQVSWKG
ncbi:UNVERIFIED_CONTAM: hypothetical protein Sradi_3664100 [Sesamum radiatum]|uniref:BED-type domain-containing protein n=1 Tax=Sesamum radiatum TaxID=300843 RepID=A0AAW2QJ19_SESRA